MGKKAKDQAFKIIKAQICSLLGNPYDRIWLERKVARWLTKRETRREPYPFHVGLRDERENSHLGVDPGSGDFTAKKNVSTGGDGGPKGDAERIRGVFDNEFSDESPFLMKPTPQMDREVEDVPMGNPKFKYANRGVKEVVKDGVIVDVPLYADLSSLGTERPKCDFCGKGMLRWVSDWNIKTNSLEDRKICLKCFNNN